MSDSEPFKAIASYLGVIRDVLLILLLVASLASVVTIYRKVSSVLNSTRRTMEDAEDIVSTVSDKLVRPAAAGSGVAFGLGKMAAFLIGVRGGRGRRRQKDRDERRRGRRGREERDLEEDDYGER